MLEHMQREKCKFCKGLGLELDTIFVKECEYCYGTGYEPEKAKIEAEKLAMTTLEAIKSRGFGLRLQIPDMPNGWRIEWMSELGVSWIGALQPGFQSPKFTVLYSIALESDDKLWLHLSISKQTISKKMVIPEYWECAKIRSLVFGDKWSIQYFPVAEEYVNMADVLHFWHCLEGNPMPDFRKLGMGI
ncbi:hypothetical protein G7B40_001335 [Aetokthonos hydrillicola Thurmond2011]|jgi:hypothetical protein|uniref:DUF7694 domain-containing protein n=1 Tax=Aetokthonos hydrillicola Thurmond2011 TaxID=2712845 RepID=A0AAP5I136_9CYAN|nr:hypothetical protein [Aetokthonos hydrillicola]MBO3463825.1 hypothetical protein [Aetokthonos hydrillicola CCALA 1050]MDR9893228.1 hypothetical protein [Aetokthonos hydrillicola Thurmond2011]